MYGLPALDSIDRSYLQTLLAAQIPEGKTLDYKQALPGLSLHDRKEFLADVSSFANTAGGLLVYGMKEDKGVPTELCGVGKVNPDEVVNRLEQLAHGSLDPRIPGLATKPIELERGVYAFVMRIPRSWASPHMVTLEGGSTFWTTDSKRKHQMDVNEIRAAFLHSETAAKRVRDFRAERLGRIVAGETPTFLPANPKVVLHVVPLGAFELGAMLDPVTMSNERGSLTPMAASGGNARYNLDGLLIYNGLGYTQLFRNGIIESVDASMLRPRDNGDKLIAGQSVEKAIVFATLRYVRCQQELAIEPPILVMVSVLGVAGYHIIGGEGFADREPIDRDDLVIPEVLVEDLDEFLKRPAETMKTAVDALWNAGGYLGSPSFTRDGKWRFDGN